VRLGRTRFTRRAVLAALTGLAGCASLRPAPAELSGRLALRVEASATQPMRSFSADFDLRGDAERGTMRLTGALGATLAEVRWQPGRAALADAQGTREFDTLEAMSQALFGEPLPLGALTAWLRGQPWSGAPSTPLARGFEQLGWRVGLESFAEGIVSATRERAPAVSLRARVERPA
jgi:outer membrane lipoprotein LolB